MVPDFILPLCAYMYLFPIHDKKGINHFSSKINYVITHIDGERSLKDSCQYWAVCVSSLKSRVIKTQSSKCGERSSITERLTVSGLKSANAAVLSHARTLIYSRLQRCICMRQHVGQNCGKCQQLSPRQPVSVFNAALSHFVCLSAARPCSVYSHTKNSLA